LKYVPGDIVVAQQGRKPLAFPAVLFVIRQTGSDHFKNLTFGKKVWQLTGKPGMAA
jgi:hypothetical protein